MMIDLNEYRQKKVTSIIQKGIEQTIKTSYTLADACHSLAYRVRELASKEEVNRRNMEIGK